MGHYVPTGLGGTRADILVSGDSGASWARICLVRWTISRRITGKLIGIERIGYGHGGIHCQPFSFSFRYVSLVATSHIDLVDTGALSSFSWLDKRIRGAYPSRLSLLDTVYSGNDYLALAICHIA